MLNHGGTAKGAVKISSAHGGLNGNVLSGKYFGLSIAVLRDLGSSDSTEVAVGAPYHKRSRGSGSVWLLSVPRPTPSVTPS